MAHAGLMTKTEGTWAFWSPEMCEGGRAFSGYAADLWAAGVVLYIFVTGKLPFYSESPGDLMEMIKEGNVPYDENMSDNLVDLLHMTLNKHPEKRAGVGDCLKHPFLITARAHRIQQLNVEFAKSKATNTVVEESDIRHVRFVCIYFLCVCCPRAMGCSPFVVFCYCTGLSYRYGFTGCAASDCFQATSGRIQSSQKSLVVRWWRQI